MSANPTVIDAEVLAANRKFYDAFSAGSLPEMNALWAQRTPGSCLHPGATALLGRQAIMKNWQELLGSSRFELRCQDASVTVSGGFAIVLCYEGARDQPAHLAATNVFVREDGEWRMVHHHAGPLSSPLSRVSASRSSLAN